jgi:hypothetical protein
MLRKDVSFLQIDKFSANKLELQHSVMWKQITKHRDLESPKKFADASKFAY